MKKRKTSCTLLELFNIAISAYKFYDSYNYLHIEAAATQKQKTLSIFRGGFKPNLFGTLN